MSMKSAPTIVIVSGMWLGPRPYGLLVDEIKFAAPSVTDIVCAPLRATGKEIPGNSSMFDDAMGVREVIRPLVEAGRRLVLVGHSAGAFIAGMTTEDLDIGQKLAVGDGGVERFMSVAGGILPVGAPHPPMDVLDIKASGTAYCIDQNELLFHDFDSELAAKYSVFVKCQPAEGWMGVCTYTEWDRVPSDCILTENDRGSPPQVQEMCAGIAESRIIRIPTGHMPMLSELRMLAEKVVS